MYRCKFEQAVFFKVTLIKINVFPSSIFSQGSDVKHNSINYHYSIYVLQLSTAGLIIWNNILAVKVGKNLTLILWDKWDHERQIERFVCDVS